MTSTQVDQLEEEEHTVPKTATLEGPKPAQIKPDLTQEPADNGPSRDELLFFAGQFRAIDEKLKEIRDERKRLRRAAKVRNIEVGILDDVMAMVEEDDSTAIERLKTLKRYAQAFDLPIGQQLNLFDQPPPAASGAGRIIEKATRTGYERGVMGLNPDEEAYPPMTDEGQAHMAGWHDGQKVLADKLVRHNEDMAAEAAKKAAKAEADATTH